MKKQTLFKIFIAFILIIAIYFGFKYYKFNTIDSDVEIFNTTSKNAKFVGVISNNYYKLEDNKLKAFNKNNNEIFSIDASNVIDVIYDKNIYIIEKAGIVKKIDRNNGQILKSLDVKKELLKSEYKGNKIILYGKDGIVTLTEDLKLLEKYENLINPVSFDKSKDKEVFIEMYKENGNTVSVFNVKNKDKVEFSVLSKNELFLKTITTDKESILITNSHIYLVKDGSIVKKILLEKLSAIDIKNNKLCIVDNKRLIIFDKELKELKNIKIGMVAEKVFIRNSFILMLSNDKVGVLEGDNVIYEEAKNWKGYFYKDNYFYLIFEDRIQKVNTY